MLKWSGTGSLPLIAGNEELLVPRRNSEVSQYIGYKIVFGITLILKLLFIFDFELECWTKGQTISE